MEWGKARLLRGEGCKYCRKIFLQGDAVGLEIKGRRGKHKEGDEMSNRGG